MLNIVSSVVIVLNSTMSVVRYSVLIALALATGSARPGANDIEDITKPPKRFNTVTFIPVNERYPSAVLYARTCGGTIISPTWILASGHCLIRAFPTHGAVLAGTNNSIDGSGITRKIKRQVLHPLFSVGPYWLNAQEFNFNQVAARWDFVLVELKEPLPLDGKTMAAAKLDDKLTHPAGEKVGYAGYGTDHFGGYMRHDMHEMQLEIQADEVCKEALEQYNPLDMICTKGRPPKMDSACSGDSGSGLIDESGHVLGTASWVQNDARECFNGALVVFSRVARVRDWIREVTNVQPHQNI